MYRRFAEFSQEQQERVARVLVHGDRPEILEIKSIPPLFLLLIDSSKSPSDLLDQLILLRKQYSELRETRRSMADELKGATTLKDREEIINEWDEAWTVLLRNEFKKQTLLKRKISSSEMASGVVSPQSGGIKVVFANVFDYWKERKLTRRFSFFEQAQKKFGDIELDSKMMKKLRIKGVRHPT